MLAGQASRTAQHNAVFRTVESSCRPARGCSKTRWPEHFLGWPLSAVRPLCRVPGGPQLASRIIEAAGRACGLRLRRVLGSSTTPSSLR